MEQIRFLCTLSYYLGKRAWIGLGDRRFDWFRLWVYMLEKLRMKSIDVYRTHKPTLQVVGFVIPQGTLCNRSKRNTWIINFTTNSWLLCFHSHMPTYTPDFRPIRGKHGSWEGFVKQCLRLYYPVKHGFMAVSNHAPHFQSTSWFAWRPTALMSDFGQVILKLMKVKVQSVDGGLWSAIGENWLLLLERHVRHSSTTHRPLSSFLITSVCVCVCVCVSVRNRKKYRPIMKKSKSYPKLYLHLSVKCAAWTGMCLWIEPCASWCTQAFFASPLFDFPRASDWTHCYRPLSAHWPPCDRLVCVSICLHLEEAALIGRPGTVPCLSTWFRSSWK